MTSRFKAAALGACLAFLTSPAFAQSAAAALRLDGLRTLRTTSPVPYRLEIEIFNITTPAEGLTVRSAQVLDTSGRVVARAALDTTLPSLGELWPELSNLLDFEHDQLLEVLEPERAVALMTAVEHSKRRVSLVLPLAELAPRWTPGTEVRVVAEVEVETNTRGHETVRQNFTVRIATPFANAVFPPGAPVGTFLRGDTHVHSAYTDCDPPFRARFPIAPGAYNPETLEESLLQLYQDAGFDWIALSDHCYCVDQEEYADIVKLAEEASTNSFTIVPGLEVSVLEEKLQENGECLAKTHDTAHLNGIGLRAVDSLFVYRDEAGKRYACNADAPFFRADAPTLAQGLSRLKNLSNSVTGTVSLNHPGGTSFSAVSNAWDTDPLSFTCAASPPESGIEILNSSIDPWQDSESREHWSHLRLEQGHRVAAYAGSDIHKNKDEVGIVFTGVFTSSNRRGAPGSLEDGLKRGRTFASSGPALLAIWAGRRGATTLAQMGDEVAVGPDGINVHISYDDGGKPMDICLLLGEVQGFAETAVKLNDPSPCLRVEGQGNLTVFLPKVERAGYLRATALGVDDHALNFDWQAFTSPIYVRPE